ncbi:Flp family type IVb pilin [Hyphomonas sp.]|uniref:Flp family type IVb pilin n=1 Tax=Hyphomonas sp. TaxID=87 RepID=UPI0025BC90A9|nr:Flp family type IVb pilin [Hyphomonas sp.]
MTASRTIFRRFTSDQAGASAVEYGLLVGLIAVAIMGGLVAMGSSVNNTLTTVRTEIN